ncbi:MAG: T9SS type A sorting domain-containing protein [Ignavibacteriales bacterium]|nr:T9SS type A sorting domain-containing protein [Ignavibacteriales bacterium]
MRNLFLIINIISFILIQNSASFSQWSDDPYVNTRVSDWGVNVIACQDGRGGASISFQNFNYDTTNLYFQQIDSLGSLKWNSAIVISEIGNSNYPVDIFLGDSNSTLVCYSAGEVYFDSSFNQIILTEPYVQKLDNDGKKLWGEAGIKLRTDTTKFTNGSTDFCIDENGGIFCFWDFSIPGGGSYTHKLYIQHISKNGERLWGENGILVADSVLDSFGIKIISDDSGGIFLQYPYEGKHFIEHYDSTGILKWTLKENLEYEKWIKDGEGGLILSAVRQISVKKLILNRISHSGEKLWGEDGIVLDDSVTNINPNPADLLLNSDNTVTASWDNGWYPVDDLFVQRFDLSGYKLWSDNLKVSNEISSKGDHGLLESEVNSNILLYYLGRIPSGLYAQRIDKFGYKVWGDTDIAVTNLTPGLSQIVSDGNYGAIVVFENDAPWGGILAQQISKNGNLGEIITSIKNNNYVPAIPKSHILSQNYPNPFNPSTTISFAIPEKSFVTLKVYDVLGREVANLVNEELETGIFEMTFDASTLSSGVYIYRITAMKYGKILFNESKQMLLIK